MSFAPPPPALDASLAAFGAWLEGAESDESSGGGSGGNGTLCDDDCAAAAFALLLQGGDGAAWSGGEDDFGALSSGGDASSGGGDSGHCGGNGGGSGASPDVAPAPALKKAAAKLPAGMRWLDPECAAGCSRCVGARGARLFCVSLAADAPSARPAGLASHTRLFGVRAAARPRRRCPRRASTSWWATLARCVAARRVAARVGRPAPERPNHARTSCFCAPYPQPLFARRR
jgi:hypothetical protein